MTRHNQRLQESDTIRSLSLSDTIRSSWWVPACMHEIQKKGLRTNCCEPSHPDRVPTYSKNLKLETIVSRSCPDNSCHIAQIFEKYENARNAINRSKTHQNTRKLSKSNRNAQNSQKTTRKSQKSQKDTINSKKRQEHHRNLRKQ